MSFTEKFTNIVTGMNKEEREQDAEFRKKLRQKQRAAYYEAKERESLKFVQDKAAIERAAATRKLKERYNNPNAIAAIASKQPKQYSQPFNYPGLSTVASPQSVRRSGARKRKRSRPRPRTNVFRATSDPYFRKIDII